MNNGHLSQSSLIFDQLACAHDGYRYLTYVWESTQYCLPVKQTGQLAILSQISIIFEIMDVIEYHRTVHEPWEDSEKYRIQAILYKHVIVLVAIGKTYVARNKAKLLKQVPTWALQQLERSRIVKCAAWRHIRFLTLIGRNKRAERGRVCLFGYHLTVQESTRDVVAL